MMNRRRTFSIGTPEVRSARRSRSHGIRDYVLDPPTPAQLAVLGPGEKLIGTQWIPKWVQRLSYPPHDRVSGVKHIVPRLWTFSRGDAPWADYHREIIKKQHPYLISQSPWVLVASLIRLILIPIALTILWFWLESKHFSGVIEVKKAVPPIHIDLSPVVNFINEAILVLAVLSVLWIPFRMWNRRITWWTVYYVVIEAGIEFYSGWWLPEPFLAQESNVEYAQVHYGIWPLKYVWGFLNVGDIIFYGQDNQEIARMRKIRDPDGCFSVLVEPLLLATEQAEQEVADHTAVSAAHDKFRSMLSVFLAQRSGVSDEDLIRLAEAAGLDATDIGLLRQFAEEEARADTDPDLLLPPEPDTT